MCLEPIPGAVPSSHQYARDLLSLVILDALILIVAIGWVAWRQPAQARARLALEAVVMTATVAVALATPLNYTTLPSFDGGRNEWWHLIGLLAPGVVAGYRVLGQRSWPALLAMLTTAAIPIVVEGETTLSLQSWLVAAALALALWLWQLRRQP